MALPMFKKVIKISKKLKIYFIIKVYLDYPGAKT
jgi:hypothetical protein